MLAYANEGARSPGRRGDGDARRAARRQQQGGAGRSETRSGQSQSRGRGARSAQNREFEREHRRAAQARRGRPVGYGGRRVPGHDFTKEYATRADGDLRRSAASPRVHGAARALGGPDDGAEHIAYIRME